MKTCASTMLVIILVLLVINSCKKDPVISLKKDPVIESTKDIAGEWNWLFTYKPLPHSDSNPLTPQNTGINEIIVFNKDHSWCKTSNGIVTDSGKYSLGNGSYNPGAHTYIYDSIAYFKKGVKLNIGDYYDIYNDTLLFSPGFAGRFTSYSLPYNGAKYWKKK